MGLDDPVIVVSLAVGAVAVAAVLAVGWRRSRAMQASGERIELVTSRYLGGKRVLTLIEVDGERLLLALSGNSVRLVARINGRAGARSRTAAGERPQAHAALRFELDDADGCDEAGPSAAAGAGART